VGPKEREHQRDSRVVDRSHRRVLRRHRRRAKRSRIEKIELLIFLVLCALAVGIAGSIALKALAY
jgi:hypothetical protein